MISGHKNQQEACYCSYLELQHRTDAGSCARFDAPVPWYQHPILKSWGRTSGSVLTCLLYHDMQPAVHVVNAVLLCRAVPLIDWISDTRSQGYTDLQSSYTGIAALD